MNGRAARLIINCLMLMILMGCEKQHDFPVLKGPYLGQTPPGMKSEVFAPELFSDFKYTFCSVFSPDGSEYYFAAARTEKNKAGIYWMQRRNDIWTKPEPAPFNSPEINHYMRFSADGSKIFFQSWRPLPGSNTPDELGCLWFSVRKNNGWSEPQPVRCGGRILRAGYPDISRNGTLYFSTRDKNTRNVDIHCSRLINGVYASPENLGNPINTEYIEGDLCVSSDERFIIVSCWERPDNTGGGKSDLYISFHQSDDTEALVQWMKDNAIPIRTIDPDDEDFSDLIPIVEKIGNARLVLLGEQSHGDGNVFLLKARLIRFLHQVMGFDVLAWESGLYDCSRMEAALHSDIPLDEAISYGIFSIWALSEQVRPVFEYARSTYGKPRPLIMAGFDCQLSSARSAENYLSDIKTFFSNAKMASLSEENWALFEEALDAKKLRNITEEKRYIHKQNVEFLLRLIMDSQAELSVYHALGEIDFWIKSLNGYRLFLDMIEKLLSGKERSVLDNNIRDAVMAQNLLWLVEKAYPRKKIIVWSATMHNMRRIDQVQTNKPSLSYEGVVTMGHPVYEKLKDEVYSIGFSAFQGKAGNVFLKEPYDIPPATENSLEEICHRAGHEMLFIDFKGTIKDEEHWLNQKMKARPLGHSVMDAVWPQHLDAMIFTETVTSSTRIQKENKS